MSNSKDFRAAIFGAIQNWGAASFPSLPIIYENGPTPDEDKIGPMWLDCEIRWYSARWLGVGNLSAGRHTGAVALNLYCKDATGTGNADDIIVSLTQLLRGTRWGSATLSYPQRVVSTHLLGWYRSGVLIPFTLDES